MGKKTPETEGHKVAKKHKKRVKEDLNLLKLENNLSQDEGLGREGEHVDGVSQKKIKLKRNKEKKIKERELQNNKAEDEGLARGGECMGGESQNMVERIRNKEKKRKRELENIIPEDEGLGREGENVNGDLQTEGEHERKEKKRRKMGDDEDLNVEHKRKGEHKRNKEKKRKRELENIISEDEGLGREGENVDGELQTEGEHERKKDKKKKKGRKLGDDEDLNVDVLETPVKSLVNKANGVTQNDRLAGNGTTESGIKKRDTGYKDVEVEMGNREKMESDKKAVKQKKKKKKIDKDNKKSAENDVSDHSKALSKNETPKKVSFSEHVEVFPSIDDPKNGKNQENGLVRGKRFSPEEDEMVQQAVLDYIDEHGLGEEGLNMVLHCRSHPEVKDCWKHIAAALPWRPVQSVYYRAHILFERDDKRTWTTEEIKAVREYHKKHGSDWRTLADAMGKHRLHVKDTWRRLKVQNRKRGSWSQEEYQSLFDLVNIDLRLKASEERQSKHGMLRDNISWEAISDKLSTRSNAVCCQKWYLQLTSSMVADGQWADVDDYRLISVLVSLDAACIEDVDWDDVLEHRSGDVCLKRWKQMTRHLGNHGNVSFLEQVEVLAKRYCPDMLEARETYDSKPLV